MINTLISFSAKYIHAGIGMALLFFYGCGNTNEHQLHPQKNYTREQLLSANKTDSRRESDDIDAYLAVHHLQMTGSGTGLRYHFMTHSTTGDSVKAGNYAKVAYSVSLLDGTLCYSSDKDGPKEFRVGEDHVESGIHEMALLMKTGDKVRFILPSNLAHGLLGDGDKIPPRAPVLYEMELLGLR